MTTPEIPGGYRDPEGGKVGALLTARRQGLEITLHDILMANPAVTLEKIRWAEQSEHPAVTYLEYWHVHFTETVLRLDTWRTQPRGWRSQWYATDWDTAALDDLRRYDGRCRWWWGPNARRRPVGAWCYLCQKHIARYDVATGVSTTARLRVMQHRALHITAPHPLLPLTGDQQ